MKVLLLDTSSMLFGIENKIDVFDALRYSFAEFRIEISTGIVQELKSMAGSRRKEKGSAAMALALIKKHNINIYTDNGKVDSWILRRAVEVNALVCTNDIVLKRLLKKDGVRSVSISRDGKIR